MSMPPLKIELPATLDAVEAARLATGGYLAPEELSLKALYRIELVIEEVIMNIASHAYPAGVTGLVRVRVELVPGGVMLQFEDEGQGFDPMQVPMREKPKSLAEAQLGGLGLALVRQVAKAISYERVGETNRLRVEVSAD